MDLIDLRNVSDLTGIDINMVDTNTLAPEMEPNRQLYFMAKSREYVKVRRVRKKLNSSYYYLWLPDECERF